MNYAFALVLTVSVVFLLTGCETGSDGRLVVASTWPASECAKVEAEFSSWRESRGGVAETRPVGIRWIRLAPGDEIIRFASERRGVDVLLGGSAEAYRSLEAAGLLDITGPTGKARWLEVAATGPPGRMDGESLASLARVSLSVGSWREGYGRFLLGFIKGSPAKEEAPEGVAILAERPPGKREARGSERRDEALAFMSFLAERRVAKPAPPTTPTAARADGLLADLLKATLVDSREELLAAWSVLEDRPNSERSRAWMCEPPPWPPASVAKIQARDGDQAMTMVETLVGQITPDPRLRSWLLRSWLGTAREVDGALLDDLAKAEGGRLAAEPRFRAWLRAEWTAWARQRYRRVARQARSGLPVAEAGPRPTTPTEGTVSP